MQKNFYYKYPEINVNKEKWISEIESRITEDDKFYVCEKVHGANLSLSTNGIKVYANSRNNMLGEVTETGKNPDFYLCQNLLSSLYSKVINLFNIVKETYVNAEVVILYGELFGGGYKHKLVKSVKNISLIQKGYLQYHPDHQFYAFDIAWSETAGKSENVSWNFINMDESHIIMDKIGVLREKPEFTGKFQECLSFSQKNKESETIIPGLFNLPKIENNIKEGYVIKPIKTMFIDRNRLIVKDKSNVFMNRFTNKECEEHEDKKTIDLTDEQQEISNNLIKELNFDRLESFISKIGPTAVKKMQPSTIAVKILNDAIAENPDILNKFPPEHKKYIRGTLWQQAAEDIVTSYFSK